MNYLYALLKRAAASLRSLLFLGWGRHMDHRLQASESGQALVLLLLGVVGMMGFAALAIDGGMLYAERRAAQSAADNAVMAAAQQIQLGKGTAAAKTAAAALAAANGYTVDEAAITVLGPFNSQDGGNYYLVQVTITSQVPSSFAHFVFGQLQTTVESAARFSAVRPPMGGYAIVTLGNCLAGGGPGSLLEISGGGNSGGIRTYDGGMFINTPETSANHCAIDPPSSSGNDGIYAIDPGYNITSVGWHTYAGEANMGPLPVVTGYNGGVPIADPLASLPAPTCTKTCTTSDSTCKNGNTFYPGRWNGSAFTNGGNLQPGIYCIHTNEIKVTGNDNMTGDGVVLYFENHGMEFSGNGNLQISAPTTANCTGTYGSSSASCSYVGVVVFTARGNTNEIAIGGNGVNRLKGTVYLPSTQINAHGGGSTPDEALVWGQVISQNVLNDGNGSLDVWYREDLIFRFPPTVNLEK